jgi:putative DNA primase/helicase
VTKIIGKPNMKDVNSLKNHVLEGEFISKNYDLGNVHDDLKDSIKVMAAYGHHIVSVNKVFYLYKPSEGIWIAKSNTQMKKLLLEFFNFQKNVPNINKINDALSLLSAHDKFPVYGKKNTVLVFRNCVVIPETRQRFDFSADFYARERINYVYDTNAPAPTKWLNFLDFVFEFDDDKNDKIAFLRQYMGLSTTKIIDFQVMVILLGGGSNGKSVILNVVQAMLGNDNVSNVSLSDFNQKFRVGQMEGKLVNVDHDLGYKSLKNEALFKAIITGNRTLNERKFHDPAAFDPTAKLWAAGNYLPKVYNSTHAHYRRILPITFNRTVTDGEKNLALLDELIEEIPSILNWALDGLDILLKNKEFIIPASSREALGDYKDENDPFSRFMRENFEHLHDDASIKEGILRLDLYTKYSNFFRDHGYSGIKLNDMMFGRMLSDINVKTRKSCGKRYYMVKPISEIEVEKDISDTI